MSVIHSYMPKLEVSSDFIRQNETKALSVCVNNMHKANAAFWIATVATAALLLAVITLSVVPGVPLVCVVIAGLGFGLALIGLIASSIVYVCSARLFLQLVSNVSARVGSIFSGITGLSLSLGEVKKYDEKVPKVIATGVTSGNFTDPKIYGIGSPSSEGNQRFPSNRLGIVAIASKIITYPRIEQTCPNFLKQKQQMLLQLQHMCSGIEQLIDRGMRNKQLVTTAELSAILMPFCRENANPILRITRNASRLFASEEKGAVWLSAAFREPDVYLVPLLRLLEKVQLGLKTAEKQQKIRGVRSSVVLDAQAVLMGITLALNVLLSGWCLSDQKLNLSIVQGVRDVWKGKPDNQLDSIMRMLDGGNILGALLSTADTLSMQSKQVFVSSVGEIDPGRVQQIIMKGDDFSSTNSANKYSDLLRELGDVLPKGLLGLIPQAMSSGSPLRKKCREIQQYFLRVPLITNSQIFSVIQGLSRSDKLLSRIRGYLPEKERHCVETVLSKFLLGAYMRGLFTFDQLNEMSKLLKDSDSRHLDILVRNGELLKCLFPKLLS